jgi:hypothetical protein
LRCTCGEWIAFKTSRADTIRGVTYDSALGVLATSAGARIYTFLIDASQVVCTFAVTDTFGPAIWWSS